jgi:outer membrane immunogenic protein
LKKLLVAGIAAAAFCGAPALAADLPTKAPINRPAPLALFNWAGAYVGIELGGKWAATEWTTTNLFTTGFGVDPVDASSPRPYRPYAFRSGSFAGYNWQIANWVFGVEGDLAWANNTAAAAGIPGCSILCISGFPGPVFDTSSVRMGWDGSARARFGYLVISDVLLYGTGGIAWQNIKTSATCQLSAADPVCLQTAGDPFSTQTNSKTLTGWTLGAGIEKMWGSWLLRAEYRYSQFGHFDGFFTFADGSTVRYNLSVNTQMVTLGLAYKFGDWGKSPVSAKY